MYILVKAPRGHEPYREDVAAGSDVHHHVHHHHHAGEAANVHDSKYSGAIREVMEELESHPAEWASYGSGLAGLMQIVALEFAQLEAAKNAGDHQRIKDELEDLAAACIHAHKNM